jgi:hypothetical protein
MPLTVIGDYAIDLTLVYMASVISASGQDPLLWIYVDIPGDEASSSRPTFFWPHKLVKPFFEEIKKHPNFVIAGSDNAINIDKVRIIEGTGTIRFRLFNRANGVTHFAPEIIAQILQSLPK